MQPTNKINYLETPNQASGILPLPYPQSLSPKSKRKKRRKQANKENLKNKQNTAERSVIASSASPTPDISVATTSTAIHSSQTSQIKYSSFEFFPRSLEFNIKRYENEIINVPLIKSYLEFAKELEQSTNGRCLLTGSFLTWALLQTAGHKCEENFSDTDLIIYGLSPQQLTDFFIKKGYQLIGEHKSVYRFSLNNKSVDVHLCQENEPLETSHYYLNCDYITMDTNGKISSPHSKELLQQLIEKRIIATSVTPDKLFSENPRAFFRILKTKEKFNLNLDSSLELFMTSNDPSLAAERKKIGEKIPLYEIRAILGEFLKNNCLKNIIDYIEIFEFHFPELKNSYYKDVIFKNIIDEYILNHDQNLDPSQCMSLIFAALILPKVLKSLPVNILSTDYGLCRNLIEQHQEQVHEIIKSSLFDINEKYIPEKSKNTINNLVMLINTYAHRQNYSNRQRNYFLSQKNHAFHQDSFAHQQSPYYQRPPSKNSPK